MYEWIQWEMHGTPSAGRYSDQLIFSDELTYTMHDDEYLWKMRNRIYN